MTRPDGALEQALAEVVDPGLFHKVGELGLLRSVAGARGQHRGRDRRAGRGPSGPARAGRGDLAEQSRLPEELGATSSFVEMSESEEAELLARLYELCRPPASAAALGRAGRATI